MEIQLTLNDEEINNAIIYWLENTKGIVGVSSVTVSGGSYGSKSLATIKVNETAMQAAITKKKKMEAENNTGEPKVKTSGRPLDMT